jgi:hypothetical protein
MIPLDWSQDRNGMTKQRKMVNLAVDETSGVDHPAHLHEGWIVFKNADGDGVVDAIADQVEDPNEGEGESVDEPKAEMIEAAEFEKAQARIAELEAALEKATAPAVEEIDSEEALIKSAPAAVVEMLEKARNEANAVREELAKEKAAQRDREFIAKAAEMEFLALDPQEFGPAIRKMADADAALADMVIKALASANAQAESAGIFAELGHSKGATDSDAYGKVESLAKAAVAKGEYKTVEQAVVGLISSDPALYEQYRNEKNA